MKGLFKPRSAREGNSKRKLCALYPRISVERGRMNAVIACFFLEDETQSELKSMYEIGIV